MSSIHINEHSSSAKKQSFSLNKEKLISQIAIVYFLIGIIFALYFAWYYHWEFFGYFSPQFFTVVFTWPYQAIGFVKDILAFGLGGKPI